MGISNRVDVVIADSDHATPEPVAPTPDPVETIDVTPDPAHRIIIVARTKTEGTAIAEARGIDPIAIVTPRALNAARGLTADGIIYADSLDHQARAEYERFVTPALAAARGGE